MTDKLPPAWQLQKRRLAAQQQRKIAIDSCDLLILQPYGGLEAVFFAPGMIEQFWFQQAIYGVQFEDVANDS